MKRFNLFFMSCLLATSVFFVAGCDEGPSGIGTNQGEPTYPDDPPTPTPDPEGTITVSVRNASNGNTSVPLYSGEFVHGGVSFGIDNGNNFHSGSAWRFASVGQVQGLGNVTKIPNSGWSQKCTVIPGYGYLAVCAYFNRMTFVRIYVDREIIGAGSGGVIGYVIKYQYPFNGTANAIGLSATSIKKGESITLNKVSCILNTSVIYTDINFSFDGTKASLKIGVAGTYTVSSLGLPDEVIVVSP